MNWVAMHGSMHWPATHADVDDMRFVRQSVVVEQPCVQMPYEVLHSSPWAQVVPTSHGSE